MVPQEELQGSPTATYQTRFSLSCLIPQWFPQSNFWFLYSTRSGVVCHPKPMRSSVLLLSVATAPDGRPQTQASRPRRDGLRPDGLVAHNDIDPNLGASTASTSPEHKTTYVLVSIPRTMLYVSWAAVVSISRASSFFLILLRLRNPTAQGSK